jgi:hypothetical protein
MDKIIGFERELAQSFAGCRFDLRNFVCRVRNAHVAIETLLDFRHVDNFRLPLPDPVKASDAVNPGGLMDENVRQ